MKAFFRLIVEAFKEWRADKASRQAASLAYYTIISLAPLMILVLTLLGWIYRDGDVGAMFMEQAVGLVGESGGEVFQGVVEAANQPETSMLATIVSLVTVAFGATGVFVQLKDALNTAWGITEERFSGLKGLVRVRAVALTGILVIGFLLLVSLFVSTAISAMTSRFSSDAAVWSVIIQILNQIVAVGLIMVLFAFIFKYLPDAKIAWKDVWVGALFTSVLFNIGKYLIGLYLGNSNVGSAFGAAGSLLVVLVWVYYSAQLILLGAEFTQVYTDRYGSMSISGTAKRLGREAAAASEREEEQVVYHPAAPGTKARKAEPGSQRVRSRADQEKRDKEIRQRERTKRRELRMQKRED